MNNYNHLVTQKVHNYNHSVTHVPKNELLHLNAPTISHWCFNMLLHSVI